MQIHAEPGRRFRFEPSLGAQYTGLRFDGSTEAGSGALDLGVPVRQVRSGRSLVGGRLEKQLGTSSRTVTLEGRASWARELTALTDVTMHLAGDSARNGLLLRPTDQPRNLGLFAGAIVVEVPRQFQVIADVNWELSGLVKMWRGSVGVRMGW
jgi:outer membrane autotransporter protein